MQITCNECKRLIDYPTRQFERIIDNELWIAKVYECKHCGNEMELGDYVGKICETKKKRKIKKRKGAKGYFESVRRNGVHGKENN